MFSAWRRSGMRTRKPQNSIGFTHQPRCAVLLKPMRTPADLMPCMTRRTLLLCTGANFLAKAQDLPPETTFRTDTRLVVLNVSVFDREGRIRKGIPKSAFT